MAEPEQTLLERRLEVDHGVAQRDQVEMREGRIDRHVMVRKDDALAQDPLHLEVSSGGVHPRRAEIRRDGRCLERVVATQSRHLQCRLVEIRGEDPELSGEVGGSAQGLGDEHRHGVGLLTSGAARYPDPDLMRGVSLGDDGVDLSSECVPRGGVSEEGADRDAHPSHQRVRLVGVADNGSAVVRRRHDACDGLATGDLPHQGGDLVLGEVDTGDGADRVEQVGNCLGAPLVRRCAGLIISGLAGALDQGADLLGGSDEVDRSRRDRRPGHGGELRRRGVLGDGDAAGGLDRLHAGATVGPGA